ncbi:hypothetical protein [Tsuneonella sp. HG222]
MFTQLNPPIPLHVLGKGPGQAIGLIDYGPEHNLIWITAIDETGEIWCAPNPKVRMQKNWTMGRKENPLVSAEKAARREQPCADCADLLATPRDYA